MAIRISEAESQVMAAIWDQEGDRPRLGAEAILEAVAPANGWGESTVRTLIHRLIRKGALRSERRQGGGVVYVPLVTRDAWLSTESRGVIDRLFGGRVAGLVAHLANDGQLSGEDVARLRRLLADLDATDED